MITERHRHRRRAFSLPCLKRGNNCIKEISRSASVSENASMVSLSSLNLPGNAEIHSLCRSQKNRSWVVLSRKWCPCPNESRFDELWNYKRPESRRALKLFGRICYENRYSLSWGHDYAYSGQTAAASPIEEGSFVCEISKQCQQWSPVNSCLQNWYEAESSLALHADDEKALLPGQPIISLSWGATRRFRIVPRDPVDKSLEINLSDGDLLIMGGDLQLTHRHDVPPYRKTKDYFSPGRRISWTFRVFRNHEEDLQSMNHFSLHRSTKQRKYTKRKADTSALSEFVIQESKKKKANTRKSARLQQAAPDSS